MKYTKILLVLFAILRPFSGLSQNIYLEIGGGPNFPLNLYDSKDSKQYGSAKTGPQGNLTIGYRFTDKFSLGLKGVFIRNEPGIINRPGTVATSSVASAPWRVNSVFIDAGLSHEIQKNIFFDLDANIGLMKVIVPFLAGNGGFPVHRASVTDRTDTGLAGGAGIGLRFCTAESASLSTNLYLMSAKPKIETDSYVFVQRISAFLISFGVSFEIKPKPMPTN